MRHTRNGARNFGLDGANSARGSALSSTGKTSNNSSNAVEVAGSSISGTAKGVITLGSSCRKKAFDSAFGACQLTLG